jgi:putative ABC transport system permease protein
MVAAGEGLRVGQQKQAENLGKDIMIVFSGRTSLQAGGQRAGRLIRWEAEDYRIVQEQSPACQYVLPELGNNEPVRSPYNSASLLVTGSLPPFADIRSLSVGEGRFYNGEDVAEGRRVAFIGTEVKKQLFASRPALGETLLIGGYPYQIVGVMKKKDQDSSYDGWDVSKIFIPFSAVIRDFPNKPPSAPRSIDQLLVTPKSLEQHEECKWQVRRGLARIHNFDPQDKEVAHIWDTVEEAKAFRQMTDGMKYFLGAVGITTLFLGGIGSSAIPNPVIWGAFCIALGLLLDGVGFPRRA